MTTEQINNIFTYHAPKPDQVKLYEELRTGAKEFAHLINQACPESREKSLAITQLQLCIMCANAAIAINS